MKRRVIQIADSTQLISLPRKWALQHGIRKGDELNLLEQGDKIVISTERSLELKKIEVDITGLDRTSILYCIQSLYRLGYDEVLIKFNEEQIPHLRLSKDVKVISIVNYTVNRLIGFEIVQQGEKSCTIKSLQECTSKEFENVYRRVFILIIDMYKDLVEGVRTGNSVLVESTEEKHDNITKFISYCLRTLNKIGYPEYRKMFALYHIISNLDKIVDILKYASRDYLKYRFKLSKESALLLEMIQKSLELYYQLFYKFNVDTITDLSENRDNVIKNLRKLSKKLSKDELLFLSDMRSSLEIILDLTEARWGLEY